MNHSFNIDIAGDVGITSAVVLEHIAFWVLKNKANNTAFQEGKYWTFSTAEGFQKYFPYLSAKQIRDAIKKLSDKGYLITGCFNKKPFDRTKWYTLAEKAEKYYFIREGEYPSVESTDSSNASDEKVKSILQNRQMEVTKKSNVNKDIEEYIEEGKEASFSLRSKDARPQAAHKPQPKKPSSYSTDWLVNEGVPYEVAEAHATIRKAKKAPYTKLAIDGLKREARNAGISLTEAVCFSAERGYVGFKADWYAPHRKPTDVISKAMSLTGGINATA